MSESHRCSECCCLLSTKCAGCARRVDPETLRDRFAMAAMPSALAAYLHGHEGDMAYRCGLAYEMADAMLKARQR